MICYSVKVISSRYSLGFTIHHRVVFEIQALQRELNVLVNLLLLAYLCVCKVEEACFTIICALFGLEPFQLDHQDLGSSVQFKLFLNVSVLFAFPAIPLIVTRKSFLLAKVLYAFIQAHSTSIRVTFLASFDVVCLDTCIFRLK